MKPIQRHHKKLQQFTKTPCTAYRHCFKLVLALSWETIIKWLWAQQFSSLSPKLLQTRAAWATLWCSWSGLEAAISKTCQQAVFIEVLQRQTGCLLAQLATTPWPERTSRSVFSIKIKVQVYYKRDEKSSLILLHSLLLFHSLLLVQLLLRKLHLEADWIKCFLYFNATLKKK